MANTKDNRLLAEAIAWPHPPNDLADTDFPLDFQAALDAFGGDLKKAKRQIKGKLAGFTKSELIEELANASCAAIAHHALLQTGHVVGKSLLAVVQRAEDARKRGGKAKAANSGMATKRQAVKDAWAKHDKRGRGTKTAFITSQAAAHKVSPRTIENWLN